MGYDLDISKLCLEAFKNNMDKVISFFSEKSGENLEEQIKDIIRKETGLADQVEFDNKPTTSKLAAEKAVNAKKLLDNLAVKMPEDDEAYLDLNMDEDVIFIEKYYSLLGI